MFPNQKGFSHPAAAIERQKFGLVALEQAVELRSFFLPSGQCHIL
jgi:hypothetical protein